MTDGTPSADACGWLHQLQIGKLLQHGVMPRGFEQQLEALQFTFQELPLWDAATPSEPICEPQLIQVDLGSMQPDSVTTAIQAPTTTPTLPPSLVDTIEPPHDITLATNLQLQGALEQLQWASPTASAPVSLCSMLRRELSSVALGALPLPRETDDPHGTEGMDSAIPALTATLTQMSPWVATPGDTPSFTHVTHSLLQPTMPNTPEVASMCMFFPKVVPTRLSDKLLPLQERMNMVLEHYSQSGPLGISATKSWT